MKSLLATTCLLLGCAASPEQTSGVVLQLHLPAALARTERRRETFTRNVSRLELEVSTRSGTRKTLDFLPDEWDRIAVGELAFPASADDVLTLSVRIWDRLRDGTPRTHPALSGKGSLRAKEMALQGPSTVPVRLSLRVPVSEYDPF